MYSKDTSRAVASDDGVAEQLCPQAAQASLKGGRLHSTSNLRAADTQSYCFLADRRLHSQYNLRGARSCA